ncbi:MAG: FAD-dependent oxidoreductase [Ardenticatenales bacterium]|nr:FAD-dependent oxidoreductase [Ardenticatenales bacterium]
MDLRSGQPFWPLKNGLLVSYPILKQALTCEVAIIGAGITGAMVAYSLSAAGVDCVVLDKRDAGFGSTSASTALLQYEIDIPLHELMEQIGEERAVRSYLACREALYLIEQLVGALDDDCGFAWKPSLYVASSEKDVEALKKEFVLRHASGIKLAFLTQEEIEALYSFSRPAALLSQEAAQVDAYRLTHRLLQKASEQGTCIFDRTEVTQYEATPDGVRLTTDRGCEVWAKRVVFATGYESQQFLQQPIVDLKSTYALVSEPLTEFTGWYERSLIWETARPYFYLRTTEDDRAIIGGKDDPFRNPRARDRLIARKSRALQKQFCQMFPAIDMDIAYAWAGTFGETKDGLAYIGESQEFPKGYFALGFGGNGMTYGILAAEIIRDLYLGRENSKCELFGFER